MKKLITIGIATVLLLASMLGGGPVQANSEPSPDTPGAWIIYPDSTPDHWVGNDRHSDIWGSDLSTSIHEALGYSGQLLYPGPDNDDIGYWEFYNPPPEGSIIELRGPSVWEIGGDGAQGGQGREKMKSLVVQQNGITIRGQDYDDGTGTMVQQEIFFNNGATTALFYLEASDLTIENLHISGTWPTNSGGYALAVGRYTMIGPDPNATGLTVTGNTFNNLRAMFDQQPTVADLTVVDNVVENTYYNIFKSGVFFTGDNTISGNTFTHVGEGKTYPALQVLNHSGTTCIDYNTFDGWRSGYYAIKVEVDISASPIGIGENNVFVNQVGGSGASYQLYPLTSGGYAVGALSEDCIITCGVQDNQGPITSNVEATPNPAPVNQNITLTATIDDMATGGSNIASAEYSLDGGTTWYLMDAADSAFDEPTEDVNDTIEPFTEPQVIEILVRGTDAADNVGEPGSVLLAVYDPSAGFVTGGGWIKSPEGAYADDPDLTGKATFGFVSKYQKGTNKPTGQTEFQFKVANLNFHSTSYDWLVVAGASGRAQYKGEGITIIGGETIDCGFMLTAIDGDLLSNPGPDKFRIKIWNKATDTIIYDNKMGASDTGSDATELGGGSIVIHTNK